MDKNIKVGIGVVVLLFVLALIIGGGDKEKGSFDDGNLFVVNTEGLTMSDWPDIIPLYRDNISEAKKIDTYIDDQGNERWSAYILVSEDEETLYSWYKEALKEDGWTVSSQMISVYELIDAKKDNLQTNFQIHFDSEAGVSSISQSAMIKKVETEEDEEESEEEEKVEEEEGEEEA